MRVSLLHRIFDLIAPRTCCICGCRLAPEEETLCLRCNLHLPRTDHLANPYENELAKVFWGRVKHIEKAAALMVYHSGSQAAYPIYGLKYRHRADIGQSLGRMLGEEMRVSGFFDGIDMIIPVPLTRDRMAERGYNQSELIARGMRERCGLPVITDVLVRHTYKGSQTALGRPDRNENVEGAFALRHARKIQGKHMLLVDDVVTTGATLCACAQPLERVDGVRISVAAIGFADPRR